MNKKRKHEALDLDLDRSLYSTFAQAANSVSQLFAQASQQQKRSHIDGQRQALEKVVNWIARENGNGQTVPTHYLLEYLRYELQNLETADQQCSAAGPLAFFHQNQNPNTGAGPSPAKRVDLQASTFAFGMAGGPTSTAGADHRLVQPFGQAGGVLDAHFASGAQQQHLHLQQQQQQQFGGFGNVGGGGMAHHQGAGQQQQHHHHH